MKNDDSDVIIIGSGAGGGTAAWALSRKGIKVTLLEAGPSYSALDYHLDKEGWEKSFPHKLNPNSSYLVAPMQKLAIENDDLRSWNHIQGRLNVTDTRQSQGYHHVKGVGGSSLHFTGEAHRLNPLSFKHYSQHGVAADWPLSYQDLEPYYVEAETFVGVAGEQSFSETLGARGHFQPAHNLSYASQHIARGFDKCGLSIKKNSLAVLSRSKQGRPPCNYCGGCLRGCSVGDKGSIDITYIKSAIATGNCTVIANANVIKIEAAANDQVKGVYYEHQGLVKYAAAKTVIVAAGAVHTPRLLLNSSNQYCPDGLANESGQVGKNFMETVLWTSSGIIDKDIASNRGLPVDFVCWDYNSPDSIDNIVGGCRFGPAQVESDIAGPISYSQRVVAGFGLEHKQQMRQAFGKVISIAGIAESLPNAGTFVKLSKQVDSLGLPLAEIHSYVDEGCLGRLRFMAKKSREILAACDSIKTIEEFSSYDYFSSTHVFGTCRMGLEANSSVVDAYCRSHRWNNLYIMDTSVFPSTGGGESPGLTVQALTLRACEKLAQSLKSSNSGKR
jgi:choline dehydrogenase-like flavoprotein